MVWNVHTLHIFNSLAPGKYGRYNFRLRFQNERYNFRLAFQNESWYVSLEWYFIYLLFLASVHVWNQWFFYSVITFSYTKCFVHSYTVDVVFTLSYFKIFIQNSSLATHCEIALKWMTQNLIDKKSTLVQVMAGCCQAPSHYLSQCWHWSVSPYGVTRAQCVKTLRPEQNGHHFEMHLKTSFGVYFTEISSQWSNWQ